MIIHIPSDFLVQSLGRLGDVEQYLGLVATASYTILHVQYWTKMLNKPKQNDPEMIKQARFCHSLLTWLFSRSVWQVRNKLKCWRQDVAICEYIRSQTNTRGWTEVRQWECKWILCLSSTGGTSCRCVPGVKMQTNQPQLLNLRPSSVQ